MHSHVSGLGTRGTHVLTLLVVFLKVHIHGAPATTGYAQNSSELADLVKQQNISLIFLTSNISLDTADWGNALGTPDNLVHIVKGRNLTLSSGMFKILCYCCAELLSCTCHRY